MQKKKEGWNSLAKLLHRYNKECKHLHNELMPPLVNQKNKAIKSLPINLLWRTILWIFECLICGLDLYKLFPEYFKQPRHTESDVIVRCARCSRPACKHHLYVDGKLMQSINGWDRFVCSICLSPYKRSSYKVIKIDRWFGTPIPKQYQLISIFYLYPCIHYFINCSYCRCVVEHGKKLLLHSYAINKILIKPPPYPIKNPQPFVNQSSQQTITQYQNNQSQQHHPHTRNSQQLHLHQLHLHQQDMNEKQRQQQFQQLLRQQQEIQHQMQLLKQKSNQQHQKPFNSSNVPPPMPYVDLNLLENFMNTNNNNNFRKRKYPSDNNNNNNNSNILNLPSKRRKTLSTLNVPPLQHNVNVANNKNQQLPQPYATLPRNFVVTTPNMSLLSSSTFVPPSTSSTSSSTKRK